MSHEDNICPKCGGYGNVKFHPKANGERKPACIVNCFWDKFPYAKSHDEHLHYFCNCGFDWIRPCKDNKDEIVNATP